jgi:hypothetical protein
VGLVAEMGAGFEELAHGEFRNCHGGSFRLRAASAGHAADRERQKRSRDQPPDGRNELPTVKARMWDDGGVSRVWGGRQAGTWNLSKL